MLSTKKAELTMRRSIIVLLGVDFDVGQFRARVETKEQIQQIQGSRATTLPKSSPSSCLVFLPSQLHQATS